MHFPTKSIIGVVIALSVPAISFAGDCFYGTGEVNSGARTAYPADWNGQDAPITYRSCDQGAVTGQDKRPVRSVSPINISSNDIRTMSNQQYCTALFKKYPTIGQSHLYQGRGSAQSCVCAASVHDKYLPASFNKGLRQRLWDQGEALNLGAEGLRIASRVSYRTLKKADREERQKCWPK